MVFELKTTVFERILKVLEAKRSIESSAGKRRGKKRKLDPD